jgi:glutamate-1-semialdehyde 2,1-aminomutase
MTALRELDRTRIGELLTRERNLLRERTPRSEALFRRAQQSLAGGVSSSFQSREPWPVYVTRGEGSRVWDVDGNEYIDFHNGFSAMVQGHAHPAIAAAIERRLALGTHFGAPTEEAVVVAKELARRFGLPRWRFTNSGTESTMDAVRIARAYTGRDDILKIFGAYHGHHDPVMVSVNVKMASPPAEGDWPPSLPWGEGIPRATVDDVHTVMWADAKGLERRIEELAAADRMPACVIVEPVMMRTRVTLAPRGYLEAVREATRRHGVLLIFDEVKCGLTIAAGGATERFGVRPDMVALAKSLAGGLPAGAVGMTESVGEYVATGRVHQVGTFNGNPLSMAAARSSLEEVLTPAAYERLETLGERMRAGCQAVIDEHGLPARAVALGSKGCVSHDAELGELIWTWFVNRGLFVTPGEQEWSLTVAHDDAAVDRYVEVFAQLLVALSPPPSGSARA